MEETGGLRRVESPKLVTAARLVAIQLTGVPDHGDSPAVRSLRECVGPTP